MIKRWMFRLRARFGRADIPDDSHIGHIGQWVMVDGEPIYILAAPNVSAETIQGMAEIVRTVRKADASGEVWHPTTPTDGTPTLD